MVAGDSSGYRGIARPAAARTLPETGAARELWNRSRELMVGDDDLWADGFGDGDAALAFRERLAVMGHWFEVVEAAACDAPELASVHESRRSFLGYDVANTRGESVLLPAMTEGRLTLAGESAESKETWERCRTFCAVGRNTNGLLAGYRDAALVQRVASHLVQTGNKPGYFHDLRVFAVHAV